MTNNDKKRQSFDLPMIIEDGINLEDKQHIKVAYEKAKDFGIDASKTKLIKFKGDIHYSLIHYVPNDDEEIYRNYMRIIDSQIKRDDRRTRCATSTGAMCTNNCSSCSLNKTRINEISMDSFEYEDVALAYENTLLEDLSKSELSQKLYEEIEKLPQDLKATIMYLLDDLNDTDIGKIMKCDRHTVKNRKNKAMGILKNKLKNFK